MTLGSYKAILCDLDGCLISGNMALPGARQFVDAYRDRLWIVSNNSTDTPETLAARLRAIRLDIPPERIFLAGVSAVDHVARSWPGCRASIFGSDHLLLAARKAGLQVESGEPEVVVLARDTTFDYNVLSRIVASLQNGARLVVTNTDAWHPGPNGNRVPETGALLAAIRACLPEVSFVEIGKPEVSILNAALDAAGCKPTETAFVGDNPHTDGKSAERMGLAFFRVGSHHLELGRLVPQTACSCSPQL